MSDAGAHHEAPPRSALSSQKFLALAVALYLLTAGWNLGGQSIANPDEPRFACAVRDMLRGGDWIVPQFNGEPRLLKPILFYWLLAATGKIGTALGLTLATGMRLAPVLMGLLTVAATFLIARRLANGSARAGFVAAVVLMTSYEFHKIAREIVVDMTLTAFVSWAWYFALIATDRIAARGRAFPPLLGFYLCLGLACMTKGPLPVAGFVVLPLVAFLALKKQLSSLLRAGLWWGAPLAVLIGFWWFYALAQRGQLAGAESFFKVENLNRILGRKDHVHPWPWAYYFTLLPEWFAPWILAMPYLLWLAWKLPRTPGARLESDGAKFGACAVIGAFLIIGLSASKRMPYLVPLSPPLAVWIGWVFHASFEQAGSEPQSDKRIQRVFAALALALIVTLSYEVFVMPMREKVSNSDAFYAAVSRELKGRKLVFLNESANEAAWYIDPAIPVAKTNYVTLKQRFFDVDGAVLLLNRKEIARIPELNPAIQLIDGFEVARGKEVFVLATPNRAQKPDDKLFVRKGKDTGKDSGED